VAIALVPFVRGTVLVYLPAFALGGLISFIPVSVWRSRALFWCGVPLLLTANLLFSHSGITRCFEIAGATAVVGCMGTRPLRMLQSPLVQILGAISYPLYLCHPIAVAAISGVVETLTGSHRLTAFALISLASLVLAVPLAWLLHVGIGKSERTPLRTTHCPERGAFFVVATQRSFHGEIFRYSSA